MRYRMTFECGATAVVDDVAHRHFLRQAVNAGYELTRVRGGHVVTLPGGSLVALLRESTYGSSTARLVSVDSGVS
jgi:hypothetical protein